MCGEHNCKRKYSAKTFGSSPRVWGTWGGDAVKFSADRFIPTCVGNMLVAVTGMAANPVHPHVCGEHVAVAEAHVGRSGSSPRVWGTCALVSSRHSVPRFIPTCVGNIHFHTARLCWTAVHPHVCGEHFPPVQFRHLAAGSSPRVWGTCYGRLSAPQTGRFIPTCVGNMRYMPARLSRVAVHPHVCGEHATGFWRRQSQRTVHPHVCGEHDL